MVNCGKRVRSAWKVMPVSVPSTSVPASSRDAMLRRSSNTMKKVCALPLVAAYLQASQRGSAIAGRESAASNPTVPRIFGPRIFGPRIFGPRISGHRIARAGRLAGRHADGAIEADGLAVQHVVLDDLQGELGVFLGIAQPRRERHLGAQALLRFGRQTHPHPRQEEARRAPAAADA